MKRLNTPAIMLCALCLAAVVGVGWFFIYRSGTSAAHEKGGGHAARQNTGALQKRIMRRMTF